METIDFAGDRARMINDQIRARGVTDESVLDVMSSMPREEFVLPEYRHVAYTDGALPIGCGQTISQPFIVALMTEALELKSSDRVLEIGTGSGYQAAILSRLCARVYTIERHAGLAQMAASTLAGLGCANADVTTGDGSVGMPEHAPFDAIIVTAGAPEVPRALMDQLASNGRLVIPVGEDERHQQLVRVRRDGEWRFTTEDLGPVRFVPLIGEAGWQDEDSAIASGHPAAFHAH